MDIFLFERVAIIIFAITSSCVCIGNKRILDHLDAIENRLNEENKFRRTDTAYILTRLDELELRFTQTASGQVSLVEDGDRKESPNSDSSSDDDVLLRAFREEKMVNSRTRRQVQTFVSTVSKLESEREDMQTVIQDVFTVLKTLKMEMTLANSDFKSSLTNNNVQVQRVEERLLKLDNNIIKIDSKLSHIESNTSEVLPVVHTLYEDTKALVENVSATVVTNNVKIQNVEYSISVLSENINDICNTSNTAGIASTAKEDPPSSCTEIVEKVPSLSCTEIEQTETGIYLVKPDFLESAMRVYCDLETDKGGWTVFQRRRDGSVDFFREWEDYRNGFGDASGEFWIGNELLHEFTNARPTELWIDLIDKDGNKGYARYSSFSIGSEDEGYILSISGYSGDVGDSLAYHNNMKFTTKDRDNDLWSENCAVEWNGAWWYNNCHYSNLNGLYLPGVDSYRAVRWYHWHKNSYSLKFTEMKFRWK